MRFHLWRQSDRKADDPVPEAPPSGPDPSDTIDVDEWSSEVDDGSTMCGTVSEEASADGVGSLRDKLLAVLADEEASLVPPVAGDMTQAEWEELSEAEREGYRREQLKRVDPRFVPHHTLTGRRTPTRGNRVYR